MAAQSGHVDTVALVLEWGAQVDQRLHDGATPLFIAAQNGHSTIATMLVDKFAVCKKKLYCNVQSIVLC